MKKLFLVFFFITLFIGHNQLQISYCFSQGVWTQKASFPGAARGGAFYFSIGNNGYLGAGGDINWFNDLWEYDAMSNNWTQKQNLSWTRWHSVSFTIGTKGYVGTGQNDASIQLNDLWEYNPSSDSWSQKANLPTPGRNYAAGFAVGNKGYICTGLNGTSIVFNDLWEYDVGANSWTQKANFPGGGRLAAVGLSIPQSGRGYVGLGKDNIPSFYDDFWEYNPSSDTWTQKSNFPGGTREQLEGAHFTICNYGYVGTGRNIVSSSWVFYNDFWKYDPVNDVWSQIQNLPGVERIGASGFSINNKGYIGTGSDITNEVLNDFWEYSANLIASVSVSPVCLGDSANLIVFPTGLTYLWSTGETTQSINVSPSTNDTVSVIVSDCSTSDTVEVTITVLYPPIANIASDTTVCQNTPATLTAFPAGVSYLWSTGITSSSAIISPSTDTVIWVVVTNSCGSDSDSAFISVNPVPQAIIFTGDSLLCPGETAILIATPGAMNYLWNTGESTQIISVNPDTSTTFSVAVTNSFGCSDTDSVFISSKFPSMNLSIQDISFCDGNDGSITVIAADGYTPYTFVWNNGANSLDSFQFIIDSLQTGDYSLTVTDAQGCTSLYDATINESPPPVVTITKNDITCTGKNDGVLSALASGSAPPYTYLWSNDSSTSAINGLMPGNYSVTIYDSLNCSATQTETLTEPPPVIGAITGSNEICQGEPVLLIASGGNNYHWNLGLSNDSLTISPDSTTLFWVIVSVDSCIDTVYFPVTVHKVNIKATGDTDIFRGGSAVLAGIIKEGSPPFSVTWNPGNISGENITVTPQSTTSYIINIIDANGCTDADTVTVSIILCNEDVFVPNAFSPDCNCPDNKLKVYSDCITDMTLQIFDRWGEKLFSAKGAPVYPSSGVASGGETLMWDGKYKGKKINAGVYVYYLKYTTIDNPDVIMFKEGNIHLLR